jgi:multiple sugar transport system permease protein
MTATFPGRSKKRTLNALRLVLTYALMILLAFIFLFPIVFMIMASLKSERAIFEDLRSFRAFLPVGEPSLANYQQVFERSNFGLYLRNSLIITSATVIASLLVNSMAAFALARLKWKGQLLVLSVILATLIIPFEAVAIPLLLLVSKLPAPEMTQAGIAIKQSWMNTLHVQIIPFVASAFSIFLFYQFFLDIPKDFDEAARVDGASPFRIYWSIILPMARPVLATVAIIQFLGTWNAYLWPIMAVQTEWARPVMPGMQQFFGRTVEWGQIMAYASMITLPVLLVFLMFQRWFIQSVAASGVKG